VDECPMSPCDCGTCGAAGPTEEPGGCVCVSDGCGMPCSDWSQSPIECVALGVGECEFVELAPAPAPTPDESPGLETVRARPGRLSGLSVSHSKSVFAWRFRRDAQSA
jgi:hypothetical protein